MVLDVFGVVLQDIEIRQQWRLGGRKYYSEQVLTYQRQHMPETIRLSVRVLA